MSPGGLVVLTDRLALGSDSVEPLVAVVEAAVRGGAAWVILREKDLPGTRRRALADQLRAVVPAGRLIVAGPDPLGGDAVHLAAVDPAPDGVALVGRSCHGRPQRGGGAALDMASVKPGREPDFITLSPIYPTATKPGYGPALGPAAAARLAGPVPWLALGGIDSAERAAACAAAGAAGIAVLGAVMRSPDPEQTARALSTAFDTRSRV